MKNIKNDNLIKNSAIIAISNKISLLQRKLFNFFIAHAYINLDKQESFEINISDLKSRLGFDSKNIGYLKESIKGLMSTIVDFNILGKDKESWSATTLLSSSEFKNGICTYSFSPVLRKKMQNPNIYAKIKLSLMKLFSSKYSLCLYEIFVDYHHIGQTPIISLEDFKKLMGIEENKYSEFKRLSLRVIKPAIKEVESIGGYKIYLHYIKENKKVVALKFKFKAVVEQQLISISNKLVANPLIQKRLIDNFGLTLRQTKKVLESYPVPYINESLNLIQVKIRQKLIKNIPAYTITVLKNDYSPLLSTANSNRTNLKTKSILQDTQKSRYKGKSKMEGSESDTMNVLLHNANNTSISKDQKKAQEYFNGLSKDDQQKLIKQFEDEKITSDILKILYKKEGITSTVFKIMFFTWLK